MNIAEILASLTADERKALDEDVRLFGNSFIMVTSAGAVRVPPEAVPTVKLSRELRESIHKMWEECARGFNGGRQMIVEPAVIGYDPGREDKEVIHQQHIASSYDGSLPDVCANCGASLPDNSPCPGDWPE